MLLADTGEARLSYLWLRDNCHALELRREAGHG